MSRIKSRLARLEKRINKTNVPPPYLSFPDEASFEAWAKTYKGRPVKVYIGVSPDDWSKE